MRNPTYLTISVQGIYHFRWPIPMRLLPDNKRCYVKLSLGTREPKEALHLARILAYRAEALLKQPWLERMDAREIKQIVRAYFESLLEGMRQTIIEDGALPANEMRAYTKMANMGEEEFREHNHEHWDAFLPPIFKQNNLTISPTSPDYQKFGAAINLAFPSFVQEILRLNHEINGFDFSPSAKPMLVAPSNSSKHTLKEIVTKYINAHTHVDENTKKNKQAILDLLMEMMGEDFDVTKIDSQTVRTVRDALRLVPRNRNKNPRVRDLPLLEAMKLPNVERISSVTLIKYYSIIRHMFEWCASEDYIAQNPFAKIKVSLERGKKQPSRKPFSTEQNALILNTTKAGLEDIGFKHYRYWGTLIGMYSGARLNEIAQLTLDDIQQKEGIWYFNMNDDGDNNKSLKTSAAKRFVPIHRVLLDLGILEEVKRLRKLGHTRFLYEMTYCKKNGYGKKLGHYFNQVLLVKLNIKERGLVFHSFRHTAVTRLYQAGVPQPIVEAIVGHERSGVSQQVYFREGYKLSQLQEALDRFDPVA